MEFQLEPHLDPAGRRNGKDLAGTIAAAAARAVGGQLQMTAYGHGAVQYLQLILLIQIKNIDLQLGLQQFLALLPMPLGAGYADMGVDHGLDR